MRLQKIILTFKILSCWLAIAIRLQETETRPGSIGLEKEGELRKHCLGSLLLSLSPGLMGNTCFFLVRLMFHHMISDNFLTTTALGQNCCRQYINQTKSKIPRSVVEDPAATQFSLHSSVLQMHAKMFCDVKDNIWWFVVLRAGGRRAPPKWRYLGTICPIWHYLGTICPNEASEAQPASFPDQVSELKRTKNREPLQTDKCFTFCGFVVIFISQLDFPVCTSMSFAKVVFIKI